MASNAARLMSIIQTAKAENSRAGDVYTATDVPVNEFCLFFKPEVFAAGVRSDKIVEAVLSRLGAEGIEVTHAVALPADYLRKYEIMNQHYGVIDRISRRGEAELASEARAKLKDLLGDESRTFLGGHQFLDRYPFFTAPALAVMYDNGRNHKLAPGTHCILLHVRGVPIVLFNGFHPEQIEHYVAPGQIILALVCRGSANWKFLRQELTGATNPARGPESSLRREIYENRDSYRLAEVSSGRNVIHVSAGPVEGAVEIARFFSDYQGGHTIEFGQTSFGRAAIAAVGESAASTLAYNGLLSIAGEVGPAFDLTEEMDSSWVIQRLAKDLSL